MDLRAVASPDRAIPFLIAARDEVATTADLDGATFGINRPGSLDHSLAGRVMDSSGVDVASVALVSVGRPSVRAQALAAERIDATAVSIGTWLSLPDREGLHVLVPPDAFFAAAPLVSKVNAVRPETLEERPKDVAAVIRALIAAARHYSDNPSEWVDAMAETRPDVDRAQLDGWPGTSPEAGASMAASTRPISAPPPRSSSRATSSPGSIGLRCGNGSPSGR